ncbi:MAG: bifunctional fucokinase/L-fucose-1-P-guanylyltransferase [Paramuribaculum sp.]|nr:bifunctional fucokinase/L-fucose-1-P-guanylyltransferase [Paramuribaculum sp.]
MYKLLSLPKDLVGCFHTLENLQAPEWYCNSDPEDRKVGSGGGTTWLIDKWLENDKNASISDKKIIIHAGGQSRRLPAYAPVGKILTPIPVFRWERGQKLNQNLLSLQLPLFEKIINKAPEKLSTLIASGDVYIRAQKNIPEIPDADVVCLGTWVDALTATHHGVFVMDRKTPEELDFMLQKPTLEDLESYSGSHYFLMDIGVWLLSEKAIKVLSLRSKNESGEVSFYDLYGEFGRALGNNPGIEDEIINKLSVAIVPLPDGEFYHFGTSAELISSTTALQNIVVDQRKILHPKIKPSPSLFVQNSIMGYRLTEKNDRVWVENSNISKGWHLQNNHIITGVPENDWEIEIPAGVCVDIIPLQSGGWAVRPYGIEDKMSGNISDPNTLWLGQPVVLWADRRKINLPDGFKDIQSAPLFPVVDSVDDMREVLAWMIGSNNSLKGREIWLKSKKVSASEISAKADLMKLYQQRILYRKDNWLFLAKNYKKSVFYQLDLSDVAENYVSEGLDKPDYLDDTETPVRHIHNLMLRSKIDALKGKDSATDEKRAFEILRNEILSEVDIHKTEPRLDVQADQIVWGRSPVRIDLAGGWSDTPPYSLFTGGKVVNMSIEMNGQQPIQVYIKAAEESRIVLRSIDLGAMETIESFEELNSYFKVGSPFSIPKAALYLAGFRKRSSNDTLKKILKDFGSGIEITLMSAIPAGSGLGTSSILAATVLGALSDFCALAWDEYEICNRTLALEQLLTTGGGWQDQYGGILPGVKLLQTESGYTQKPTVSWLPQQIFNSPGYKECHLLYYTGFARVAKGILSEIVKGMFLNSSSHLTILNDMKEHALLMADSIQRSDFYRYGKLVAETWRLNKLLDSGTETVEIHNIIELIKDMCLGYKLPGAGGGGFLYMIAKDPEAAIRIRQILKELTPNPRARFVDMTLSNTGFKVTRS